MQCSHCGRDMLLSNVIEAEEATVSAWHCGNCGRVTTTEVAANANDQR